MVVRLKHQQERDMSLFLVDLKMTTSLRSYFGDLSKIKFYRRFSSKDIDQNFDLQLFFINFDYFALEVSKWPFFDSNTFVQFVYETRLDLSLWFLAIFLDRKKLSTSLRRKGEGLPPGPAKPVTPGVLRII